MLDALSQFSLSFLFPFFFFFNDTATTEIYTLSLHDALPICTMPASVLFGGPTRLTLMTGTCSRSSHANASATESTAPPVARPQNTSTAYRVDPGAAP